MSSSNDPSTSQVPPHATLTKKVPFFNPVEAPKLLATSTEAVREFAKAYDRYIQLLAEYNNSLKLPFKPQPLKLCIDPDVLETICQFRLVCEVNDVTEIALENWIEENRSPKSMLDIEELDRLVRKELKMKGPLTDMPSRILELFADHKKILKKYGSYYLVTKQPKRVVRHIMNALTPPAFKKIIDRALQRDLELWEDFLIFYKYVDEVAQGAELYIPETRIENSRTDFSQGKTVGKDNDNSSQKSFSKNSQPKRRCWKCQGDHHLKFCPITTPEEKESLQKSSGFSKARSGPSPTQNSSFQQRDRSFQKPFSPSSYSSPTPSSASNAAGKSSASRGSAIKTFNLALPGRLSGRFNNILELPILMDSGACESCIGEHQLVKLLQLGADVTVKDLQKPFSLLVAFSKGRVMVEQSALLKVTLVTSAGPIELSNVLTSVIKDDSLNEFILGRTIMEEMGIDSISLATKLALTRPIIDCSRVVSRNHGGISSIMSSNVVQEEESNSVDDNLVTIGSDTKDSITEAFNLMLEKASKTGLEEEFIPQMESLLEEFRDIWRLKLGNDPPVRVEPMKIVLKPDAQAVMCKSRRYPPIHRAYMAEHVAELERFNLVYPNRNSSWASPPLIVPKPNSKTDFRMTVDVRRVNEQTLPTAWPMPNLEVVFRHLEKSTVYASFDLIKGYWQLPLDPSCQEYMSFMTDSGIYTPTRVIQGATGAVAFCQSAMQTIIGDQLYSELMVWLDDVLAFSNSTPSLLAILRTFFQKCRHFNLKLNAAKCCLFSLKVKWCGRIISAAGISQDPARVQALISLAPPITGADLQQFVCAMNWMRTSLPDFAKVVSPLQTLLETVYGKASKRTKKAVQKVLLEEVGWDKHHLGCFEKCKNLLANSCTLAHPKEDHVLCVFTDASLDFWEAVVTQIPQTELSLPFENQSHVPLAFLSGAFKGAPSRWPIIEKEAFAIVETCSRLDYLLLHSNGFHLFTDHKNLQYLFNPFAHHPGLQRHIAARLQRWALILMSFEYTIQHIASVENCWADLLSRWRPEVESSSVSLLQAPIAPSLKLEFGLPKLDVIKSFQSRFVSSAPDVLVEDSQGLLRNAAGLLWIPDEALDLQLRLCVAVHMGSSGHRSVFATMEVLKKKVFWTSMMEDVKSFLKSCLHCETTSSGFSVPRPLGEALHGDKPNEVLHFDYLYMTNNVEGYQYVLVLKEDFSGYCELVSLKTADARTTADALIDWCKRFGKPKVLVSDQGSHFKNQLVDSITEVLGIHHHFTVAYVPWSNGTVERLNREIFRMTRCLLSEFRLATDDWVRVIPLVQMALNNSPRERIAGVTPIKAFLGLDPTTALDTLVEPSLPTSISGPDIFKLKNLKIQEAISSLEGLHKTILDSSKKNRARGRAARKGERVNFGLGDFVFVATQVHKQGSKLLARWRGPRKIVKVVNDWVFEVQDLLNGDITVQHAARLKLYADSSLDVDSELLYQIGHDGASFEVKRFLELRPGQNPSEMEILTEWLGLSPEENSWEPLQVMYDSVPRLVLAFLRKKTKYSSQAKTILKV